MSTKGPYPFTEKELQYSRYTIAMLTFALSDTIKARDAMRGHDVAAEGWYSDDAATIASEIRRR